MWWLFFRRLFCANAAGIRGVFHSIAGAGVTRAYFRCQGVLIIPTPLLTGL